MRKLLVLGVVLAVASSAPADVLWDNNIDTNGSGGRAISPPGFPNIRVVDDFVVDGAGWLLEEVHYYGLEDGAWEWDDGDGIEVSIYADQNGVPSSRLFVRTPGGIKMAINKTWEGRAPYHYWAEFANEPLELAPGKYWIGMRHPTARGTGTNYWVTSDGGRDGKDSSTGYFSLDSGNTWMPEGDIWHHAFVIEGREIPEPSTLALLAIAGLAALRRRTGS